MLNNRQAPSDLPEEHVEEKEGKKGEKKRRLEETGDTRRLSWPPSEGSTQKQPQAPS